jgi:hypothetical protein
MRDILSSRSKNTGRRIRLSVPQGAQSSRLEARMRVRALLILVGVLVSAAAAGAEPSERTREEIAYLFSHLRSSGCEFYRNGSWYPAARAADHLNQKYEYLTKRKLISTTESFIEREQHQPQVVPGALWWTTCCEQRAVVH